jgi:7-cyano-7-deazaguanine synthase
MEYSVSKKPDQAYVSLSGGLDSSTCLGIAVQNHGAENVHAVSLDYGQRHKKEMEQAKLVCAFYGVDHRIIQLPNIPKSMLTDTSIEVPNMAYKDVVGVSPTYVPFRNGLLISTLAALASPSPNGDEHNHIYFGAHAEDAENDAYPDCRLDFIGAMGAAIYIGTYHRVRLHAPLIEMSKAEVVWKGAEVNTPFELTWSCYKGEELHCGTCMTCRARKEAFSKAGIDDPTVYAA